MISTDGVLKAASAIPVLDAPTIADNLNIQQSQKFVDPNCHPEGKQLIDISDQSFCDSPLEDRDKRLNDALTKLPKAKTADDHIACTQAALVRLQELIKTKFDFSNLPVQIEQANFMEEKAEAQLELVSYVVSLVQVLNKFKPLPSLVSAVKTNLAAAQLIIGTLNTDDKITSSVLAYALNRLAQLQVNLLDVTINNKTYAHSLINDEFVSAQLSLLRIYTTDAVIKSYNKYLFQIDQKISYQGRKPSKTWGGIYDIAGNKLVKAQIPNIDDYYNDIIKGKIALHDQSWTNILVASTIERGAIIGHAFLIKDTPDIDAAGFAQDINTFLTTAISDLSTLFSNYVTKSPKPPTKQSVFDALSTISFCGQKLPNILPTTPDLPAASSSADLNAGFDSHNKPTITDLEYWQRYSVYLDVINLLPIYWTIGLYVPTPAGILKVPLPTVWIPLVVLNLPPVGLVVIFLTINGIAISPTIWMLDFPPGGQNDSNLVVMLRKFNQKIKNNTGNKLLNVPVVNGININTELTKTLPFEQDDLPIVRRMSISNIPFVAYLNQWMKIYITGGGLP